MEWGEGNVRGGGMVGGGEATLGGWGVFLVTVAWAWMSAPPCSRTVTVPVFPYRLASIRAVVPPYRGQKGSGRHRLKPRAVLRCAHVECGLDVGPLLQQE
jgi:hypothetical protein